MLVGIYDPVQPFIAPDTTFATLVNLRAQIIRLNLDWNLIATRSGRRKPTDPADPAYNWSTYDRVLLNAAKNKIQVLFTILGTPRWANGKLKGTNRAPAKMADLRYFALAAAKRYSGKFKRDDGVDPAGRRKWLAWNEPNNPVFLKPQWAKIGRRCTRSRITVRAHVPRYGPVGAKAYVGICTAIWTGVHASHLAKEVVGCGATDPHGNNAARNPRPSISPTAFLQDLRHYGLKRAHFDVYAHHPYYSRPSETPATKPKGKQTVTLGNISRADQAARQAVRQQEALDHRVRLPDPPAGPGVRRHLGEAGQVPDPGLRDRPQEPAHHDDALVPAPRRGSPRRLAVRSLHRRREEEARVQRVPPPATLGRVATPTSQRGRGRIPAPVAGDDAPVRIVSDIRAGAPFLLTRAQLLVAARRLASITALVCCDLGGLVLGLYTALVAREIYYGRTPVLWGVLWRIETDWLPFLTLVTVLVFSQARLYEERERRPGFARVLSSLILVALITLAFAIGTGHQFSTYGLAPTAVILCAVTIAALRCELRARHRRGAAPARRAPLRAARRLGRERRAPARARSAPAAAGSTTSSSARSRPRPTGSACPCSATCATCRPCSTASASTS